MNNSQEIHEAFIPDEFIICADVRFPLNVLIRCKLNELGFKFEDDGKLSCIMNENPIPLGKLTYYRDPSRLGYAYRQVIDASS